MARIKDLYGSPIGCMGESATITEYNDYLQYTMRTINHY